MTVANYLREQHEKINLRIFVKENQYRKIRWEKELLPLNPPAPSRSRYGVARQVGLVAIHGFLKPSGLVKNC
jgi:hypothetical protein